ncbi:ABC transporter permease [Nocardiopsis sp. RSe5-2]|uniref:ABC transporter permease n=1 Tax=Nocardiopsis endophytica TaxID=3018445 RepID=A0ABT4UBS9_9ACTN|nr:ABC transporter permease [Nocardiopsis endophytica]MDA2813904.1 ABC transporter permease [Nocardiopsis endophytica]
MFVAWRDLGFAKGRFALIGAVIVLITLLVGMLSGLTAGLARENVSAVTGLPADLIAFDRAEGDGGPSFSDSAVTEGQWREWARAPGVQSAEPLGITTTKAETGDGASAAVSVFGVRPGGGLGPVPGGSGDDSAVLSEGAAEDLGAGEGDTVTVAGRELAVVGVGGDASFSHTPVVWTSLGAWQGIAPPSGPGVPSDGTSGTNGTGGGGDGGGTATVIAVTTDGSTDGGTGTDAALADTDEKAGTTTVAKADSLAAIGSYTSENGSLQLMRGFLFAISALVIGAFFTVWTIQRGPDVAVLKALGASTGALLRDALGQALVLLVGGTAAGTAAAAALGAAVSGSDVPFVLTPGTVLAPAAVMVALGALGAALSVRRITSVDPLTALGSAR